MPNVGSPVADALSEGITQAIIGLRGLHDPEQHVNRIVDVARLGLDLPGVSSLAIAEVYAALGNPQHIKKGEYRWGLTLKWALAKLQPPPPPAPIEGVVTTHNETPDEVEQVASDEPLTDSGFIDREAMRHIVAIDDGALLQVYVALLQITRDSGGSGKVAKKKLKQFLRNAGVQFSDTTFKRWIEDGLGKLWNYDPRRKNLYHKGQEQVCGRNKRGTLNLTEDAHAAGLGQIALDDLVGDRDVRFYFQPTTIEAKAHAYALWLGSRRNPKANISRSLLRSLWGGVTRQTLQHWENIAGIKVKHVFREYKDGDPNFTAAQAAHAAPIFVRPIRSRNAPSLHWRVQDANRYITRKVEIREHTQAPRQRRRAALLTLKRIAESNVPDTPCAEARARRLARAVGQELQPKIYFFDKWHKRGVTSAHKQIAKVVKKTEDYSHPYAANVGVDPRFGNEVAQITYGEPFGTVRVPWWEEAKLFRARGGRNHVIAQAREWAVANAA